MNLRMVHQRHLHTPAHHCTSVPDKKDNFYLCRKALLNTGTGTGTAGAGTSKVKVKSYNSWRKIIFVMAFVCNMARPSSTEMMVQMSNICIVIACKLFIEQCSSLDICSHYEISSLWVHLPYIARRAPKRLCSHGVPFVPIHSLERVNIALYQGSWAHSIGLVKV